MHDCLVNENHGALLSRDGRCYLRSPGQLSTSPSAYRS
jgi:hypothetical protein